MKYENAKNIFPENLLKEIQKYAQGKVVYIPICEGKRSWGETSGYKQYLNERNFDIRKKFMLDSDIDALAEEYSLSVESIKKIVYSKKERKTMKESVNEKTQTLNNSFQNYLSTLDILKAVYNAMEEKCYDPVNQIVGYIVTGDPSYITSYKNARDLVMEVDLDELLTVLIKGCLGK